MFPLAFGLVPPDLVRPVAARLAEHVEKDCDGHFDAGILATPLLLEVLTVHGRADLAYRLMTRTSFPSFGYMLPRAPPRCGRPGRAWARTTTRCSAGRAEHLSPRGRVVSGWRREGGRLVVTVEVPTNAIATLSLPGRKDEVLASGLHKRSVADG